MGRVSFRTIFGGPRMPAGYRTELAAIKERAKSLDFRFKLDVSLTVAGDLITVTHPSGLRSPRIHRKREAVTASIFINNVDVDSQNNAAEFLRGVIYEALDEILTRMENTGIDFDRTKDQESLKRLCGRA